MFTWKTHCSLQYPFGQIDWSEICTDVSFTSPEAIRTLITKLHYTKVKFYPKVKSQTSLSSFCVSCKCAGRSSYLTTLHWNLELNLNFYLIFTKNISEAKTLFFRFISFKISIQYGTWQILPQKLKCRLYIELWVEKYWKWLSLKVVFGRKSPKIPVTNLIDLRKMKDWFKPGAIHLFWPLNWNSSTLTSTILSAILLWFSLDWNAF